MAFPRVARVNRSDNILYQTKERVPPLLNHNISQVIITAVFYSIIYLGGGGEEVTFEDNNRYES